MNKKQRSISALLLFITLLVTNSTFSRGGGGHGGGGGRASASRSSGVGRSFTRSSGGINKSRGYGRGGRARYGGWNRNNGYGWVAPVVATTAVVGATVAASSANRSVAQASQSSPSVRRSASRATNTSRRNSINRSSAAPSDIHSATRATQNSRSIRTANANSINRAITQHKQNTIAPAGGNSSERNRPIKFDEKIDGHRAYGFYRNGECYPTWFRGGVAYYWYGGMWSPWLGFWDLYPWWYSAYYTKNDAGQSEYDQDISDDTE